MRKLGTVFSVVFIILFVVSVVSLNNKVTPVEQPKVSETVENIPLYTDYSDVRLANAKQEFIVLFFHANWCPSCKAFEEKILSETIPENIQILKVDFDKNSELRKKYNVLSQTTFILVDRDGELRKRWV
jgi:thiol:disulfide interchange protein